MEWDLKHGPSGKNNYFPISNKLQEKIKTKMLKRYYIYDQVNQTASPSEPNPTLDLIQSTKQTLQPRKY